ncbi:MAG: hypothetical protein ACRBBU_10910 [Pseudooceanicola sp.]
MISSLGLGSLPIASQPNSNAAVQKPDAEAIAPVQPASGSGGATSGDTSSGSASGDAGTGQYSQSGQSVRNTPTGSGSSDLSQSVQSRAVSAREQAEQDSDRMAAIATQRAIFRSQLVDRIGNEPVNTPDLSVPSTTSEVPSAYARAADTAPAGGQMADMSY